MVSNLKQMASSGGHFLNSGNGFSLQIIDIQHPGYVTAIQPDIAFWCLVKKDHLAEFINGKEILAKLKKHSLSMSREMETLRFGLKPSAVYLNPTEQCNLNCTYCYIPEGLRRNGKNMSWKKLKDSLRILKDYFDRTIPDGRKPQVVFHGSEPLMNKENVFRAIEEYYKDFDFGIQTNGTLLEKEDFDFISSHNVVIGISVDGHKEIISDQTRKSWNSGGMFKKVLRALEMCHGYSLLSVICTVTVHNVKYIEKIVEYFHKQKVENCMLNPVRCTLAGGRQVKPSDAIMAKMFIRALDRTYKLLQQTGRKLIIVNFANILLSIIAPSARRLMCDINPCGGGRCFFAVSARGDVFPCSEFISLSRFKGGNLFKHDLSQILESNQFNIVTNRRVENIEPCNHCAIRHFCGTPCPAEAYQLNGAMKSQGAFCGFYEYQARYAFKLIADKKEGAYLWDNWDRDTKDVFKF